MAFERARAAALLAEAQSRVAEIDRALVRLAVGTDTTCEVCGGPSPGRAPGRSGVHPDLCWVRRGPIGGTEAGPAPAAGQVTVSDGTRTSSPHGLNGSGWRPCLYQPVTG